MARDIAQWISVSIPQIDVIVGSVRTLILLGLEYA